MSEKKGGFTITGKYLYEECDDRQPLTSKEEEERRIAEMGRPILGEHTKLEVIIEESYEFKVCLPTLPTGEARPSLEPRLFIVLAISGTGSLTEKLFRAELELESW